MIEYHPLSSKHFSNRNYNWRSEQESSTVFGLVIFIKHNVIILFGVFKKWIFHYFAVNKKNAVSCSDPKSKAYARL